MANQYLRQFFYAKEPTMCALYAKVTFGAAGAPTLVVASSKGVKSIVRNGAGDFTITLSDSWYQFMMMRHVYDESVTAAAPAASGLYLKAVSVNSPVGAGTIRFILNAAGTATDPASGEILYLEMNLKNSSAF